MSTSTEARPRSSQTTKPTPRRAMSRTSPLSRAAHELAERRFPVFPLVPRSKKPITKHGCKDATTDPGRIGRWWKRHPAANIGIATGNGLAVIDIDSEGALDYAREMGLPDTLAVRSGRDGVGQHHYFEGDLPNKLKLHDGIHVQGDGAYVVAPPSVHPDTGALYEWLTDPGHPLALVPEWALDAQQLPSETMLAEGEENSTFKEGERHDRLYKLARAMRGIGMEAAEIESALRAANETRCVPVLTDEEIEEEITGSVASVVAKPAGWKPDMEIADVAVLTGNSTAAVVYAAIRHACGYKDRCKIEQETLAEKIGKGRDTVSNAIKRLVQAGLIEAIPHKTKWGTTACTEYVLLDRDPA